jgi:mannan endo-1,4-beta-mannosidase
MVFTKYILELSLIFLISIFLGFSIEAQSFKPVNPKASKEAKKLIAHLYELKGKGILSGQHNYGHERTRSTDSVFRITGKYPAIWGCDFITQDFNTMIDRRAVIDEAIRQYKNGAIITLMYHQNRPYDHDTSKTAWQKMTPEEWTELTTPGTRLHGLWLKQMDSVAYYLKILRDKKIPVLWRPYHEMNGGWFWWGSRPGPDGYQKLWKMLYERYTNYHKLNNLIWVWNANAPRVKQNDNAMAYENFYPGNEYVDILAADIYNSDYKQSHHDQLVELGKGKLIAMGEIGDVPSPEILKQQPQWSWFMVWARFPWTKNTPEEMNAFYNAPSVISLDEVRSKK